MSQCSCPERRLFVPSRCVLVALLLASLLGAQWAGAQPKPRNFDPSDYVSRAELIRGPRLRLVGLLGLGSSATAGGTIEAAGHYYSRHISQSRTSESNTWVNIDGDLSNAKLSLELAGGGGLELSFPLHRNFLLGGFLTFTVWDFSVPDGLDHGTNLLVDFGVLPTVRGVFAGGALELYGSMPVGATVSALDADALMDAVAASYDDFAFKIRKGDAGSSTAVGFFIRWVAGLQYFFGSSVGAFAEVSYCYRVVGHGYDFDYDTEKSYLTFAGDLALGYDQFVVAFGLTFAWGVKEAEARGL